MMDWFGYWPTFHDAEVLSIVLNRSGESRVEIHAFETTREADARGYFVLAKHAVITFNLEGFPLDSEGVTKVRVEFFIHQNVLNSASVEKTPDGYVLTLDGIFGADASICCERMSVSLEPGGPSGDTVASRLTIK